jgi:hypothetical protein
MRRSAGFVGLLACMGSLAVAAPQVDPAGVWEVVDYTATDPTSGAVQHPFGPHPIGAAIYTRKGHMSVFVSGSQRSPSTGAGEQRARERAGLFDSLYAYTGTYTVKGDTVFIHVQSAWQPDWVGTDKTRKLRIDHGFLTITTAPMTSPVDGKTYISVTRFRRVE